MYIDLITVKPNYKYSELIYAIINMFVLIDQYIEWEQELFQKSFLTADDISVQKLKH